MKILNPPSVTLPFVHPALIGSPLLSAEVLFMEEIWKDVRSYEGIYKVSNFGRIKSLPRLMKKGNICFISKEKILSPIKNNRGYFNVMLCKNSIQIKRTIHQLVAETFLNHYPCGYKLVVNHKDFNGYNNMLDNLEIITQRENTNLKHKKHSSEFTGVSWNKLAKKWKVTIKINGVHKHLGYFGSETEAAKRYDRELEFISIP